MNSCDYHAAKQFNEYVPLPMNFFTDDSLVNNIGHYLACHNMTAAIVVDRHFNKVKLKATSDKLVDNLS